MSSFCSDKVLNKSAKFKMSAFFGIMHQVIDSIDMNWPPSWTPLCLVMVWLKWRNSVSMLGSISICKLANLLFLVLFNQALQLWCVFGLRVIMCSCYCLCHLFASQCETLSLTISSKWLKTLPRPRLVHLWWDVIWNTTNVLQLLLLCN